MIAAASGDAKYAISAIVTGRSVNATAASPPATTALPPPSTDGQAKYRAPSPTRYRPSLAISVATKSPSYSMADPGRRPNTSATERVNVVCSALAVPPSRNRGDDQ